MTSNIKDVARRAGVSTATVSHVINNTRPVSEETRRKVQNAIKGLNYQPNVYARTLRNKQNKSIAILLDQTIKQTYTKLAMQSAYHLEQRLIQASFQPEIHFSVEEKECLNIPYIIIQMEPTKNTQKSIKNQNEPISLYLSDQVFVEDSQSIYAANEYYHSIVKKIEKETNTIFLLSFHQGEQIKRLFSNNPNYKDIFKSIRLSTPEIGVGYEQIRELVAQNHMQKICITDYNLALGAVKLLLSQSEIVSEIAEIMYYGYSKELEIFGLPIQTQYFSMATCINRVMDNFL